MAPIVKAERLMNLAICLLSTKRFVSKEDIRAHVSGYQDQSDQAFERMFERDKEELRSLGVPIETGSNDVFFDDEYGYRVTPGGLLPPVEFDADEAALVGLAARAWHEASITSATQSALAKLRAVGVEVDAERLPGLHPVMTTREPGFGVWFRAILQRIRVTFDYAARGTRTVEPWGLTHHRGRWYVSGRDVDKDELRTFRLSRINGEPRTKGRAGAFTVPEGTDVHQLARALDPEPDTHRATVAVRPGRAAALRRRGELLPDHPGPDGFEVYGVGYASGPALVGEIAGYGSDVVVLEPVELRRDVIAHLQAWAGGDGTDRGRHRQEGVTP